MPPDSSEVTLTHAPRDALDITLKALWRARPEGLVRFATGDEQLRLVRVLDAQPIAIRRSVDGVALVEDAAGPFIEHLEFETAPDARALAARVYVYAAHLFTMMKHRYPVRSTVLLLEDRLPTFQPEFLMTHGDEVICRYCFRVLRLRDLPAERFLADPALAALVPFSREVEDAHLLQAREVIRTQARPVEVPELLAALYIIAGRCFDADHVRTLLWSQAVMESTTYQEIEARGYERGLTRGEERALQRALLRARARMLRLLEIKYGAIPATLREQVQVAGEAQLDTWTERLLSASSLEEVFSAAEEG